MVRVRWAAPDDLDRLLEIALHSPTAARWQRQEYEKLFSPEPGQERAVLVVEEEGQVMGFIVGRVVVDDWEIENIAVSGPAQRRGLGSRLLGEFLKIMRLRGGRTVFLEVRESNLAARKLYEKWAFLEAGRRKNYYQNPLEDALVLRLSFPESDFD